jgi:hypothetical protein
MIQITLYKHDYLNESFCRFASKLSEKSGYSVVNKVIVKYWFDIKNIEYDDKFDVQEVNECILIYKGDNHLMTIKFEL